MKTVASLITLAAAATAHYTFDKLEVNGQQVGGSWEYIREHTRGYMPTKGQQILENDFRCQPGGDSGANTGVYSVGTGDKVRFLGAFGMTSIEHPGPAQVYMSKTDDVKSYDGSGDWFKVRDALFCKNPGNDGALKDAWCTWGQPGIEFTVPETIPDGEYLVRVEHIPLHGAQGTPTGAEYYYSCAQLKVEGSTVSALPAFDTIKIPGGVQPDDPAVEFNIWTNVQSYPYTVGPSLIPGGTTWGTADGSSAEVVVNGGSAAPAPAATSSSAGSSSSASSSSSTGSSTSPSSGQNSQTVEQPSSQAASTKEDCDVQYIRRSFSA